MGKVISYGIQKGGVGKTMVTGVTSWLLSKKNKKVLVVDFDSQGNTTQFLTRKSLVEFKDKTVLEACKDKNPIHYIYKITENLHILPADDFLSKFPSYLYNEYKEILRASGEYINNPHALSLLLKETLEKVKPNYDFIFIDLPPNLGEQTINGIAASDYCVVMLQAEPFCKDALERYLETIESIQTNVNDKVYLAGILTSMIDVRTALSKHILERTREEFESLVFDTVIRRKARLVEFTFEGITDQTKEDKEVLRMYEDFAEELLDRVSKK